MMEWAIVVAVQGLKLVILGALALVSHVADFSTDCCPTVADSASVAVLQETEATFALPVEVEVPDAHATAAAARRAVRIQRLVPPVRVEITFTPDLLHPPTKDPSL